MSPARLVVLVRTELLKLRTTRLWWGLLIVGAALTAIVSGVIAAVAGQPISGSPTVTPGLDNPAILRSIYGGALSTPYLIPLVIGILGMAGEYRHKTITPTFLAVPRRGQVVAGKLVTYLLVGLATGAVMTAVAVLVGGTVIAARGYPLGLDAPGVPRTMALAVLGCGVWSVFGLGLGTLIRNQVAAITVAIGAQLLEQLLTLGLNQLSHGGDVAKFLPSSAASAMVAGSNGGTVELVALSWWAGALTLVGYGVFFAAIGAVVTTRRDVS